MKIYTAAIIPFFFALSTGLQAQNSPLSFYVDNSNGQDPLSQLQSFPANYSFPDTPAGSSSAIGVRVVNTSSGAVEISAIGFVNGTEQNNNFTANLPVDWTLAPGQSQVFSIYFVPLSTGSTTAGAQIGIVGSNPITFSTLQGNGTAPQITLSCNNASVLRCDGNILQPNEEEAINFGQVSTTSSLSATFTLSNGGTTAINPAQLVSLQMATNNPSTGFQLGTLPASIPAGSSGTFTVTFAPGTTTTQQATLMVASGVFILHGVGLAGPIGDISSLVITYTDSTGVNLTAQPATPINFGTTIAGSGTNATLLFTASNPSTTIGPVSVPVIAVSGAGFAISGTNPAPATIQPGTSITFSVTFSGSAAGNYSGTLMIGSRQFGLTARSTTPLTLYLDNSNGQDPLTQLQSFPANYSFPDTPAGSSSAIGVRVVNTSSGAVEISAIGFVNGTEQNNNFTANLPVDWILAPGQSQVFSIYFVPLSTGSTTASAQIGIVGNNQPITFSTLQGNGTAPQITLSCNNPSVPRCNGNILQPNEETAINFGQVSTTSSLSVTFTLTNGGTTAISPAQLVSIPTDANNPSTAFQLGALPASIPAGSSGTFTVTFAPGVGTTLNATLFVGSETFILQGVGLASVTGDISSLKITYTDSTGVNLTAQPATPINFGTTIAGSGTNATLLFTVSNPSTTIGPVIVPNITVSGAGFAISGTNPAPATIQPGSSITFSVIFSGSAAGNYAGTLMIGSRQFSLTAQSATSSFPAPSITVDQNPLLSQQQAHVTVQLAGAAPSAEIGTLTLQFTPSVSGISDDPAIGFVSAGVDPNGKPLRQLQVTVASGAQTATYNDQSALTFQSGTTAGTITFTVQFPNQAAVTQTFTIAPSQVQITSGSAVIQSPNLVVTLTGYDNTYSTGQLSFTFYGTTGQLLTPAPISVNAASKFQYYFFDQSQAGGAFSLQATFPVTGDPTQVGSVGVTLTNSVGQTSNTQSFQ